MILAGEEEGKRYWVELKSWMYKPEYLDTAGGLRRSDFPVLDGSALRRNLNSRAQAHRQHFLDYAASRDPLKNPYWNSLPQNVRDAKPAIHRTWVQVWKNTPVRKYQPAKKKGQPKPDEVAIKMDTPWMEEDGVVLGPNGPFERLQRYLTQAPGERMPNDPFEATIGYRKIDHDRNYQFANVGKLPSTVAPFTLRNAIVMEMGASAADQVLEDLRKQIGGSDLQEFMDDNLTDEQKEKLRKKIQDEFEKNLGVLKDIQDKVADVEEALLPEFIRQALETAQGAVDSGVEALGGDALRNALNEIQVPDSLNDFFCEAE